MSFSEWKCTEFGKVNNEWSIGKLGEFITTLTDYHANGSYKKLKENVELFDEENYAIMIRTTNFEQNYFEKNGFKYITEHAYDFLEKSKVLPDDILMNKIANAGSVYLMPNLLKPVSLAMNLFLIRVDQNKINQRYVYYFLKNNEEYVKTRASGSVTKTITKDNVRNLEIAYPNINEQNFIVSTLSTLEQKIELNNCINKTLEEMAQAIFKSWFVDFEPFQDGEFEDSDLGIIPKGWSIVSIDDVTSESNTGGDAIQKTPIVDYDTGIKCVRVGDMSNKRGIDGWGFSNVNEENFKKYQLKKNDIIVTRTATLGLNQIIDEDLNAVYNNGLIRLKLNEKVIPLFFYQTINTDKYKEYIGRIESESSTRPNMKINYLLKYKFVYPPLDVQNNFVRTISELRKQKLQLSKEIQTLTSIRDSLLPKLMSGEIRVPTERVQ